MAKERDRTLKILKLAIQMETDGKEYYLKVSRESSNEMGRELLKSLAAEEDRHKETFMAIYETIRSKKDWPEIELPKDRGKKLRTIFAQASAAKSPVTKAGAGEFDAVQTAIAMEVKSYTLYTDQSKSARYPVEKEFYEKLAAEERQHHLILLDYYEYLKDPAQWFYAKEHSSVDGG